MEIVALQKHSQNSNYDGKKMSKVNPFVLMLKSI